MVSPARQHNSHKICHSRELLSVISKHCSPTYLAARLVPPFARDTCFLLGASSLLARRNFNKPPFKNEKETSIRVDEKTQNVGRGGRKKNAMKRNIERDK